MAFILQKIAIVFQKICPIIHPFFQYLLNTCHLPVDKSQKDSTEGQINTDKCDMLHSRDVYRHSERLTLEGVVENELQEITQVNEAGKGLPGREKRFKKVWSEDNVGELKRTFKYLTEARLRIERYDQMREGKETSFRFSTSSRLGFPKMLYFELDYHRAKGEKFLIPREEFLSSQFP